MKKKNTINRFSLYHYYLRKGRRGGAYLLFWPTGWALIRGRVLVRAWALIQGNTVIITLIFVGAKCNFKIPVIAQRLTSNNYLS